ncbi:MAG TPA: asparagine synthase (glutamine-hydrolyzing), partial [Solirubrobacterales bacterium]|nr:asparagine synthase (glutamine-hydrolyzing) [Solirubrobacterales bacterium]
RGPDAQGIYTAPYVGLGQRRLSIIDLSDQAVAPLSNEDGSVWVTYNGEIYNFQELRASLTRRGHRFRTAGDTEVIAHLYEEHGVECLAHLRGMFAFALWDARARRLFAARDRFGKKPLYYARVPGALVFGSEIKAITADPDVPVAPNYLALDAYLTHQYVPSPLTAFESIAKLPAGHYLTCGADGEVRVERYWRPPPSEPLGGTPEEAESELRHRLREAVRMRLVSDVPLGAFLSGGLDSSTVVALMAEASGRPVKTFSIGFEPRTHDELPYARQVAERYGTDHHEFVVEPRAAEVLPLLVHHYNEPFADSSALPTYYLARLTRQHVTVALSGDGGDESFAGYDNYRHVQAWGRADALPRPVRDAVALPLASALDRLPYRDGVARASRALQMLAASPPGRHRLRASILKDAEKRSVYTREFRGLLAAAPAPGAAIEPEPWSDGMDALDWMMRHDRRFYLPDCLMTKVDVASMAVSLEVRCPLLDHPLVEFAARIPSAWKQDRSGGKAIFKRAVAGLLPAAVLARPKMGFGVPIAHWFRTDLAGLLRETLLDDRARRRNLFEIGFVRRMVEDHVAARRDWSTRLWALLCLELWFREFVD